MTGPLRPDLRVIADHIPARARILDVGCGDGTLMMALRDTKDVDARGLEIDPDNVAVAIGRGLSVVQGDADVDLAEYMSGSFDFAVLSQTLQTTHRPAELLDHLLRIGRRAFVSFPNFAHWKIRLALLTEGRMPVTRLLPVQWYDTPNIHHLTIADFRALVDERGYRVEKEWFLTGDRLIRPTMANLTAEHAVFLLGR